MWKKDNSDWSKEQGYTRHDYRFDDVVCGFCLNDGGRKSCKAGGGYSDKCGGAGERESLITFLFSDPNKDLFYVWLYSAIPYKNDYGEIEQISITVDRSERFKDKNTIVRLKFEDCDYDPYHEMDLNNEEIEKLLQEIPLFKEADAPFESVFGKLNFFDGTKEEWVKAYQSKFEELVVRIKESGQVKEPDI